jgi:hypothetical protein
MDMEYIIIVMEINFKANIKIIRKKDMEYIIIIMEINLRVNIKMI